MAYYIRVDSKDDLDWMTKVLDNLLSKDPNNPTLQINYNFIVNWREYISSPVAAKEVADITEQPEAILSDGDKKKMAPRPSRKKVDVKKKRTPKEKSSVKQGKTAPDDIYSCKDHPTYGAKRRPRVDCKRCWELFAMFNPPDVVKMKRTEFLRLQKNDPK
jgi:hypothetical protein